MKPAKSSHKSHKSLRGSPIRKSQLSKKIGPSRSPMRISRGSRPPPMKQLSPGMKRGPPLPSRKQSHSPRLRSIASSPHRSVTRHSNQGSPMPLDRVRSIKRNKYEKGKISSVSPIRRMPMSPHDSRDVSPYADRYLSSRPPAEIPHYPASKKARREPERFGRPSPNSGRSPPRHRADISLHSESQLSLRNERAPHPSIVPSVAHPGHRRSHVIPPERDDHPFEIRGRPRPVPLPEVSRTHSKPASVKPSYSNESSERYRSTSPGERYPPASGEKQFGPTLHERFSSVVETSRGEPRIRYSRDDLEKITIDIRRNLREQSPTLRRIMNPSEVKLVRRANEGHRPIFDREEIKQAPRDLREDAYYERKIMSGGGLYSSAHSMNLREIENYEITRHRFDTHHGQFHSSSGRTLSDRWQNTEARKESTSLDRDERERNYERVPVTNFVAVRSRSRSRDRDFRPERYAGPEASRSRPDFQETHHRTLSTPPDPRSSLPSHRKDTLHPDSRRKLAVKRGSEREIPPPPPPGIRSESRGHFHSSERRYSESLPIPREKHHSERRSPPVELHKWSPRSRSHSRERLPDFSRRPDKYKSYLDKPDLAPRGLSYFEHDNREGSEMYRGRSSSRPFRSIRGFRSRGFRGPLRGSVRYRGSFRGYHSSISPRGRGAPPRRGRFSPSLWEHDLYSRSSQDRKLGNHGM